MVSLDLKSLEARKVEIGDAIDASHSALLNVKDKIEKAKKIIKRANFLLSKAKPVCLEEITRLDSSTPSTMKSYCRRWQRGLPW